MADVEKVIKGLECCRGNLDCSECPYEDIDKFDGKCEGYKQIHNDALELLKEQSQIVRCKDCKYQNWINLETGNVICRIGHGTNPSDWFCADGERAE